MRRARAGKEEIIAVRNGNPRHLIYLRKSAYDEIGLTHMAPELIERFHFALLTEPDAAPSIFHEIIDAEVNKLVHPVVVERTEVEGREATSRQILLQQAIERSKLRPFATILEVRGRPGSAQPKVRAGGC